MPKCVQGDPSYKKNDNGKVRFSLVPPNVIREVAQVFTKGAEKYAPWNYLQSGSSYSRFIDAAHRHINAFELGENADPEWGYSHIAHAICSLMMLLAVHRRGSGVDDRANLKGK